MNALEKYEIQELEGENSVEEKECWSIKDLGSADWALRKIEALKAANEEIEQLATAEKQRINEWEASQTQSNLDTINFFSHKLGEYLEELRKIDKKAKITTPHGTVSTRKKPDSWEYASDAVVELKEAGLTEFIKVTETVNKADFKKAVQVVDGKVVTTDGEVLKSVKVVPQGESLVIKGGK